jgi:hypothetical protein
LQGRDAQLRGLAAEAPARGRRIDLEKSELPQPLGDAVSVAAAQVEGGGRLAWTMCKIQVESWCRK